MVEKRVAVLHTTPVTLPLFKDLLRKELPDYETINFLDDSILPMLAQDAGMLPYVMEKLDTMCGFAKRQGARGVLCACSSIGEITEYTDVDIPVMRVDEAMMTQAAKSMQPSVLCATAATTLAPSSRLLQQKGVSDFKTVLISDAAQIMEQQGKEAHDRHIAQQLLPYAQKGYTLVLCQASMAAASAYLPAASTVLTSPQSGAALLAERMRDLYGG